MISTIHLKATSYGGCFHFNYVTRLSAGSTGKNNTRTPGWPARLPAFLKLVKR